MDVAEGDVVGPVEHRRRHQVEPAAAEVALHVAGGHPGGEAVREHDGAAAPLREIRAHLAHRGHERLLMGADAHARPLLREERRLEVRDAVEGHGPVLVVEQHGCPDAVRAGDEVDARLTEPVGVHAEAGDRVVVAARQDDLRARVPDAGQRALEQLDRGRRRRGRVEDVPGDEHHVDPLLLDGVHERLEHHAEVVEGGVGVERAADVPVGGVQQSHGTKARDGRRQRPGRFAANGGTGAAG